jgi:hypothetical protein
VARPMPLVAPVTRAVLPMRSLDVIVVPPRCTGLRDPE